VAAKYDGIAYDTDDLEAGDISPRNQHHAIPNIASLIEYLQKNRQTDL